MRYLKINTWNMKKITPLIILIMMFQPINAQVRIIAHRGASYIAPENTIASARLAWKYRADAVECDIWMSKDSMIICSHDGNTKRITGQDYKISETSSVILRKLDAGSFKDVKYKGQKLPFLSELIKTVPTGKELVIEIKCGVEVLPLLKKEVGKDKKNRVFTFICFDLQTIIATKKLFPGNSCYWLSSNADLLKTNFNKVAEEGLNGVSLNYSIINEDVMKKAADLKLQVFSWTVDNPEEAARLISLGVKGITTNRPGWLIEQVEGLGR
jgi:glycerophosphoryl diester phosphodiesterase